MVFGMTGKSEIFFLHGFWGTPDDFDEVKKYLVGVQSSSDIQITPVELEKYDSTKGLKDFADCLNAKASQTKGKKYLVGYSMGGRLALHALMSKPELWSGAVLISTHPGLREPKDKAARTHWQNQWAEKFLTLSQQDLEQQWGAQEVFKQTTPQEKSELTNEKRRFLATALMQWGSDRHLFTWSELKNSKTPLLWCMGEEDHKYQQLLMDMRTNSLPGDFVSIPRAGHRVIFDQPEVLAKKITAFIRGTP